MAASQLMHLGAYPYRASSTEFVIYIRRGLAGSVLIGVGRSVFTRRASIRNGCSLGFLGFSRLVMWQECPGCSTDAVEKKTGSAASSRGRRLTVHHTTQPPGGSMTNSSETALMPKKMPVKSLSVICIFPLLASNCNTFSPHAEGMAPGSDA